MARTNNLSNFLTDVASAIKEKKGDDTTIPASSFDTEILALPSQGVYQSKQMTINTNGNYEITPDNGYDAIESLRLNVEAGEDLTNVLNTQDQKIAELEEALENKTAGGKVKLNIYTQTTEPEEKDGIWLQTDKTFNKVCFDENVKRISIEGWDTVNNYPATEFTMDQSAKVGNYIYIFSMTAYSEVSVYKYDMNNNIMSDCIVTLNGYNFEAYRTSICSIGTDIYLYYSQYQTSQYTTLYKYDTTTDTISVVNNISGHYSGSRMVSINTDIYILGGSNGKRITKYDTLTNQYSIITNENPISVTSKNTAICVSGNQIYLFDSTTYVFDTTTNTFTQLRNLPFDMMYKAACVIDNYIYLRFYNNNFYKYDILTNSYTQLSSKNLNNMSGYMFPHNNKIYFFPNDSSIKQIYVYALTYDAVYDYENNSVVVWDGFGKYKTQITQSAENQEGKIQTLFYDAYYYTTENGLDDTISTYYGDGTQWIKFKN